MKMSHDKEKRASSFDKSGNSDIITAGLSVCGETRRCPTRFAEQRKGTVIQE